MPNLYRHLLFFTFLETGSKMAIVRPQRSNGAAEATDEIQLRKSSRQKRKLFEYISSGSEESESETSDETSESDSAVETYRSESPQRSNYKSRP